MLHRIFASVLVASALAGCGGGGSPAATGLDRFLGTWTVNDGKLTAMCPSVPIPITMPFMADQTIDAGTDSDLVFNIQPGCQLLLDVSGDTASARPGQTCVINAGGSELPATVDSGMLRVSGRSATFAFVGQGTVGVMTCTFNVSGTSTKTAGP